MDETQAAMNDNGNGTNAEDKRENSRQQVHKLGRFSRMLCRALVVN